MYQPKGNWEKCYHSQAEINNITEKSRIFFVSQETQVSISVCPWKWGIAMEKQSCWQSPWVTPNSSPFCNKLCLTRFQRKNSPQVRLGLTAKQQISFWRTITVSARILSVMSFNTSNNNLCFWVVKKKPLAVTLPQWIILQLFQPSWIINTSKHWNQRAL